MLKGHGAPNTGVVGNVGDLFEDLDTGKIYKLATIVLKEKQMGFVTIPEYVCETNQYVWVPVVGGGDLPFGEETIVKEVPVILVNWDGNIDGRANHLVGMEDGYCHVSDIVFEDYRELLGKTIHYIYKGEKKTAVLDESMVKEYIFGDVTGFSFWDNESDWFTVAVFSLLEEVEPWEGADPMPRGLYFSFDKYKGYVVGIETGETTTETTEIVRTISGKYVEGMGWSEGVSENIFNGAEPAYGISGDRFTLGSPRININKPYDITIRGDVYKNVAPVKFNSYYPEVCWGNDSAYDIAADAEYPFQICAGWVDATDNDGNPIWDNNGDFVGKPGNVDSWMYPHIRVSPDKYPDLKPDDVQITECEVIHPIDPKFMPNMLVTMNVVLGDDGMVSSASMKDASFAEILSALKSGTYVCVYFKNNLDSTICVGAINNFNDEFICVYDRGTYNYFVILPDNTVTLD